MSDLGRRRRHARFTANRLIPNAVTLLAICAGMTAIRLGMQDRWELAVVAVGVAMVLDAMDGRIARLMNATSEFGAHLDSLSDVINFGVSPAILVYMWCLHEVKGLGWALALVFAICCALRLARFNTALTDENPPPWASKYFTGVPAPGGAGLALLPMSASFVFGDDFFRSGALNGFVLMGVAALMVSRIPTYSAKRIKIPREHVGFILLLVGAFAAFLVSTPWITLTVSGFLYLATIPMAVLSFRREQQKPTRQPAQVSRDEEPDGSP